MRQEDSYFARVHRQTPTRFWINNVTREQAGFAIEHGAVGCTQNPSYTWKMMQSPNEAAYVRKLSERALRERSDNDEALTWLQRELVAKIAEEFWPLYVASRGREGYVSIQGDPFLEDYQSIVEFARFNREAGANIMAKIPAVEGGLRAIEILAKECVPINATECMAVRQVLDVCETYRKATRNIANPAPLYFSVITGIFDQHLTEVVAKDGISISPDVLWYGGLAVAKKVYALVKSRGYDCHFISGGARGLHHFTEMVGADAQVTINWAGTAEELIASDPPVVQRFFMPTPEEVLDELCSKLDVFRKAYFINGIEPEEYDYFGPVVLFRSMFEEAWTNSAAAIAAARGN